MFYAVRFSFYIENFFIVLFTAVLFFRLKLFRYLILYFLTNQPSSFCTCLYFDNMQCLGFLNRAIFLLFHGLRLFFFFFFFFFPWIKSFFFFFLEFPLGNITTIFVVLQPFLFSGGLILGKNLANIVWWTQIPIWYDIFFYH